MESFARVIRPNIQDRNPLLEKVINTPEPSLNIWRCQGCDCECAGESIYHLCSDCEKIQAMRDHKVENYTEFFNQDREERQMQQWETEREYLNHRGI